MKTAQQFLEENEADNYSGQDRIIKAMEEYANSKIQKWIKGKPDREHTCLMMVKVYNNGKFLWDEYIVGRIDETGDVVFMNDDSVGWNEDAIECWMDIPKGATAAGC